MNPLAHQLNSVIKAANPHLLAMLSATGKRLFFPKGILSQSAEAKEKATRLNASPWAGLGCVTLVILTWALALQP